MTEASNMYYLLKKVFNIDYELAPASTLILSVKEINGSYTVQARFND